MSRSFNPASVGLALHHHIGGSFVAADGEIDVRRPSDGIIHGACPIADTAIVDHAVEAARGSLWQSGWAAARPRERVLALHAWADLIETEAKVLGRLESVASTRPIG